MRSFLSVIIGGVLLLTTAGVAVNAQVADKEKTNATPTLEAHSTTPQGGGGVDYHLKRGDNEFGFWGGVSFAATTVFGGLHDDEASGRRFFVAAFRYGRTLAANESMALQYTLDAIPIAVASGNIVSSTTVGPVTTFRRETAYGAGVTPLGLQLDFRNGSQVKPFIHVNGGLLVFNQSLPLPDAGKLALVGEAGSGIRIFTSQKRAVTLGFRFHHISNGDRSGSNRGLNQFVFYAGYSLFK